MEVKKVEPSKTEPKPVEVKKVPPKPKPKAVAKTPPKRVTPKRTVKRKAAPRRKAAQAKRAPVRQAPKRAKDPGTAKAKQTQKAEVRPGNDGNAEDGRGQGGGVLPIIRNPRFGRRPNPAHYPRISVQREEEGTVIVRALVHRRGTPTQVRVHRSSGYPRLDHAALQAVRRWVFLPMQRGGRTVTAWVEIPVRFRLH